MTRLFSLMLLAILMGGTARAQTFYSLNAGTDGFNFNVTNALPFVPAVLVAEPVYMPPPPPRHHHHHHHHHHAPEVHFPLLPGYAYEVAAPAAVYYDEVADYRPRRVRNGVEVEFNLIPGLVVRAGHDFDDDHHHHHGHHHHDKHYKKHHRDHHDKHYKKHHRDHHDKHYKHHEKKHHRKHDKHHGKSHRHHH